MTTNRQYDYIIAGAGCAGLSLVIHLIQSGKFQNHRILIVDKSPKTENDRTWCSWEQAPGLFESIVYQRWDKVWFHSDKFSSLLTLTPYQYKLIRGIDFYKYCYDIISQHKNIEIRYGHVQEVYGDDTYIMLDGEKITADYVFSSIIDPIQLNLKEYHLQQHFKGWFIETKQPFFKPDEATLMDFRVGQQHGTTFVYTMPFSPTRALVEYTLFTPSLLTAEQYQKGLADYLRDYMPGIEYTIYEEEFGIIPMTNYRFPISKGNIIYLGTAGGQTKSSSGYTFHFIQKHAVAIVRALEQGKHPSTAGRKPSRFHFYDSTFLHVLQNELLPGATVFSRLFEKNKPQRVLRFLDNESSLGDELAVITSLPTLPFLKGAIKQW